MKNGEAYSSGGYVKTFIVMVANTCNDVDETLPHKRVRIKVEYPLYRLTMT